VARGEVHLLNSVLCQNLKRYHFKRYFKLVSMVG
jgi:hypothetical protein